MSGGHFNHGQWVLNDIASMIEEIIKDNDSTEIDRYGDSIGYGFNKEVITKLKETSKIAKKAHKMIHDVDYLLSGDLGEESFLERINEVKP